MAQMPQQGFRVFGVDRIISGSYHLFWQNQGDKMDKPYSLTMKDIIMEVEGQLGVAGEKIGVLALPIKPGVKYSRISKN